ncbi:hypothetical protein LX36DRAFT_145883 [Colletotrichum falcatum]|nr:hypothetical protein LX36DRAFT_145883 [Colletotrichum falcatum]
MKAVNTLVVGKLQRARHPVETGLSDGLPVGFTDIACRRGWPKKSRAVPCFRLPAAAAALLLARSRRPVRQSRFCESPGRCQLNERTHQSAFHPIPPSPHARRPGYSIHIFQSPAFAALAIGLDPKRLVFAMDGVPFTAPHDRNDPMSLPTAALHRVSLSAATRFTEANDTS